MTVRPLFDRTEAPSVHFEFLGGFFDGALLVRRLYGAKPDGLCGHLVDGWPCRQCGPRAMEVQPPQRRQPVQSSGLPSVHECPADQCVWHMTGCRRQSNEFAAAAFRFRTSSRAGRNVADNRPAVSRGACGWRRRRDIATGNKTWASPRRTLLVQPPQNQHWQAADWCQSQSGHHPRRQVRECSWFSPQGRRCLLAFSERGAPLFRDPHPADLTHLVAGIDLLVRQGRKAAVDQQADQAGAVAEAQHERWGRAVVAWGGEHGQRAARGGSQPRRHGRRSKGEACIELPPGFDGRLVGKYHTSRKRWDCVPRDALLIFIRTSMRPLLSSSVEAGLASACRRIDADGLCCASRVRSLRRGTRRPRASVPFTIVFLGGPRSRFGLRHVVYEGATDGGSSSKTSSRLERAPRAGTAPRPTRYHRSDDACSRLHRADRAYALLPW